MSGLIVLNRLFKAWYPKQQNDRGNHQQADSPAGAACSANVLFDPNRGDHPVGVEQNPKDGDDSRCAHQFSSKCRYRQFGCRNKTGDPMDTYEGLKSLVQPIWNGEIRDEFQKAGMAPLASATFASCAAFDKSSRSRLRGIRE
jgi:hypothetical protein